MTSIYGRVTTDEGQDYLARVAYEARLRREMESEGATFVRLERAIPAGYWDPEQRVHVDGWRFEVEFERNPAVRP